MFLDVLAAVDASPAAERVAATAADLARAFHARLTLLSVAADLPTYAYNAAVDVRRLEEEATAEADRTVRAAAALVPQDVSVRTVVRHGQPGREIVREAEAGAHDLIVLGSRGRGKVAAGLFGSVVGDVHFHTRIPLLIVPPAGGEDVLD